MNLPDLSEIFVQAEDVFPMAVTVAVSLATNMAYGFIAGIASSWLTGFVLNKLKGVKTDRLKE